LDEQVSLNENGRLHDSPKEAWPFKFCGLSTIMVLVAIHWTPSMLLDRATWWTR